MYHITEEHVLAYVAGAVTNPKLRTAIEEARDTNPEVQYWFDLLDPESEDDDVPDIFKQQAAEVLAMMGGGDAPAPSPTGTTVVSGPDPGPFVSEHDLCWPMALDGGGEPPPLDHSTALPLQRFDPEMGAVTLKYLADSIPLGVARVAVKEKGRPNRELGSTLVVFRTFCRGEDTFVRVADVRFDALGLSESRPSKVWLYVTPARPTNLTEFPLDEVLALRDACNGDCELRDAVEELIRLLEAPKK